MPTHSPTASTGPALASPGARLGAQFIFGIVLLIPAYLFALIAGGGSGMVLSGEAA